METTSPLVVIATIAFTEVLKRVLPAAALARIQPWIPTLVVLVALAVQTAVDTVTGSGPLTARSLFAGLGAAAFAVLTHAQFRGLLKSLVGPPKDEDPTDAPPARSFSRE